jgi:hypothetical protein
VLKPVAGGQCLVAGNLSARVSARVTRGTRMCNRPPVPLDCRRREFSGRVLVQQPCRAAFANQFSDGLSGRLLVDCEGSMLFPANFICSRSQQPGDLARGRQRSRQR